MTVVEIEDVAKRYGTQTVLRNVSLRIEAGERVAVVGTSGAGKSTLLSVVAAFDRPDAGTITYTAEGDAGRTLRSVARGGDDADAIRRRIGFVFQTTHMMEGRTSRENIELPLKIDGVDAQERRARSDALAREFGLSPTLLERRPSTLSGGERQRLAIARAMARTPTLILADEPTGNLDGHHAEAVRAQLEAATGPGQSALLLVTHDLALAERLCTRTVVLRAGTLHVPAAPPDARARTEQALRKLTETLRAQVGLLDEAGPAPQSEG